MRRYTFTRTDLVVLLVIIALLGFLLLPPLRDMSRRPNPSTYRQNASQVRGIHQALVIFAQSNNGKLPGLDKDGETLLAGLQATGSATDDGSTAAARYWLLINGMFIAPSTLIAPEDAASCWTTGSLSTANFSHALLRITGTAADRERREEWADNNNSRAVMVSDRNAGRDNTDGQLLRYWSTNRGVWRGDVAWGDNHVTFEKSNLMSSMTVYGTKLHAQTTNDNLFADAPAPGVTEAATQPSANAMMTTTN